MFLGSSFTRLNKDLFGSCNGLLSFLLLHASGGLMSFLDQGSSLRVGPHHDFVPFGLGLSQFSLYSLGISESLGDLLAPLFQHLQDRFIRKAMQKDANDGEADDLS